LTWKSDKLGYHARVINSGRHVNDAMGAHVGKQVVKKMLEQNKNPLDSRILVMGLTFKEDVADIRNTKVVDVIRELKSYNIEVDVVDPFASPSEVAHEYGFELTEKPAIGQYDAVVLAVSHEPYREMDEAAFEALMKDDKGVLADLKGLLRGQIERLNYWSL
jgi:UDP-N-acetyl-D-galactosamine dehydrogenase